MKVTTCPTCSARFDITKFAPGARLRCSRCKTVFPVPADSPEPAPDAEAAVSVSTPVPSAPPRRGRVPTRPRGRVSPDDSTAPGSARPPARGAGGTRRSADAPRPKSRPPLIPIAIAAVVLIGSGVGIWWSQKGKGGGGNPASGGGAAASASGTTTPGSGGTAAPEEAAVDWKDADSIVRYLEACRAAHQTDRERAGILRWRQEDASSERLRSHARSFISFRRENEGKDAIALVAIAQLAHDLGCVEERDALCSDILNAEDKSNTESKYREAIVRAHQLREDLEDDGGWVSKEYKDIVEAKRKKKQENAEWDKLSPREKEIRKKLQELKTDKFCNVREEVETIDAAPYLLCAVRNTPESVKPKLEQLQRDLKDYLRTFFEAYGPQFGVTQDVLAEAVLPIAIFKDRNQYSQATNASEYAGGHFEPATKNIYMYFESKEGLAKDTIRTIFHEGTHQILEFLARRNHADSGVMFWFTEGMATNFEAFRRDADGRIVLGLLEGKISKGYCPRVKAMVREGKHVPFETILSKDYSSAVGQKEWLAKVGDWYAESWSIVYFMYNYRENDRPKYREKWDQYVKTIVEGKCDSDTFPAIFGPPEALEKEWLEFIKALETP